QGGYPRDHRSLDIAHHQSPGAIDPYQYIGAVTRHMRNGIGDQSARMVLLRWSDSVLQVQNDSIRASVGAGLHKLVDIDRDEHQRTPNRQVFAHSSLLYDAVGGERIDQRRGEADGFEN